MIVGSRQSCLWSKYTELFTQELLDCKAELIIQIITQKKEKKRMEKKQMG